MAKLKLTANAIAAHSSSNLCTNGQQVRILVADDEAGFREMLCDALSERGYDVLAVANGDQALAELRRRTFHLVVTDLLMPDRDGIEIIRAIGAQFPQTKIIAVSGGGIHNAIDLLGMAESLGAGRILAKPIHLNRLLATIESLLEFAPPHSLEGAQ